MKRLVCLLLVCLLLCGVALADTRTSAINDAVEDFNRHNAHIADDFICTYDAETNVVYLAMNFEIPYSRFDPSYRVQITSIYYEFDDMLRDLITETGYDVATVTTVIASDGVAFALFVNGSDQSWMLDGV